MRAQNGDNDVRVSQDARERRVRRVWAQIQS
jgi:hypothetical protein